MTIWPKPIADRCAAVAVMKSAVEACALRPATVPMRAVLAPLLVWAFQFMVVQALLGLGCGRLATTSLRWLVVVSGVLGVVALVQLALRRRHTGPAAGVALAGVAWSTLTGLWLAPCAVVA